MSIFPVVLSLHPKATYNQNIQKPLQLLMSRGQSLCQVLMNMERNGEISREVSYQISANGKR